MRLINSRRRDTSREEQRHPQRSLCEASHGGSSTFGSQAGSYTTRRDIALGANGISAEYPVMRHAANLESVPTYEGAEEIHMRRARPEQVGTGLRQGSVAGGMMPLGAGQRPVSSSDEKRAPCVVRRGRREAPPAAGPRAGEAGALIP